MKFLIAWRTTTTALVLVVVTVSLLLPHPALGFLDKLSPTTRTAAPSSSSLQSILDNKGLDYMFDNNEAWRKEMLAEDRNFFKKLAKKENPEYLWVGCSNSQVPPSEIMGEEAKNVLVAPNVANSNINQDVNLLSAIQFSVAHMKVKDVIVCGIYDAEGVRMATTVRNVYKSHQRELDAIPNIQERQQRLVNFDVTGVCLNIFKTGVVQKRRQECYEAGGLILPRIHAMVFNPQTGDLKRIPFDFTESEEEFTIIYGGRE